MKSGSPRGTNLP